MTALVAAACFGAAAPLSKLLLRHRGVAALSFLLYVGAFLALTLVSAIRGASPETRVGRRDLAGLATVATVGGVVGSLLLNLEAPLTVVLAEHVTVGIAVASVLMIGGVAAFLSERHEHRHVHATTEHDHLHEHDEHHQHEHDRAQAAGHSHSNRHAETAHAHAHASDAHHSHG